MVIIPGWELNCLCAKKIKMVWKLSILPGLAQGVKQLLEQNRHR